MDHLSFDSKRLPSRKATFHVRYLNKCQVINEINQHRDLQLNPSQLANEIPDSWNIKVQKQRPTFMSYRIPD